MSTDDSLRFGRFELRLAQRQLLIDGQPATLGNRAFDLLAVLVARRDRMVSKDELISLVWPGLVVEENNLQVQVSTLRKLLGAQVIATLPGRGYRFTAPAAADSGRQAGADPRSPVTPAGPTPVASLPPASPGQAARLLVADDNKVNRLLLCRSLELQGHHVASVDNGRQALAMLRSQRFELLLLDLEMPELDGYALLEQLALDAELRDLPVIVTSSVEGVNPMARCIELGAEDFLHKPVNPVLLKARVKTCLEKKRLREQQKALVQQLTAGTWPPGMTGAPAAAAARRQPASVLVARLHGASALAASEPPEAVLTLLDSWHTLMVDAVLAQGGVVNQAGGEAVTAVFGAALPWPEGRSTALAAVRAALDMVEMVELFNAERDGAGLAPVAMGVGITTGEVVAGCTGVPANPRYTCVGDPVERAQALAVVAEAPDQAILVDASTQAGVAGQVATQALPGPPAGPAQAATGSCHAVRAG